MDDSLSLFKDDSQNAKEVANFTQKYVVGLGQIINRDKSAVMFSKNTKTHHKREIMDAIQLTNEAWNEKYLGMPSDVGSSKNGAFQYLKDYLWSKV